MATVPSQKLGRRLKTFHFVVYLHGVRDISSRLQDRLVEAGCDDAALVSQGGKVFLDFDRQAPSMPDAIRSALTDIERAGVHVSEVVLRQ
jgi:hypothetical protein